MKKNQSINLNKETYLFLKKFDNLTDKHIIVGFSGGADSTALLDTIYNNKDTFGFKLSAIFFSHGDSPIAEDEDKMLAFCKEYCLNKNITFINNPIQLTNDSGLGWESAGRKSRQEAYKKLNVDYIFLGHHQDDQNETVMIQLFRGGGKGTSGMLKKEGIYCRPFLDINKNEIINYLIKNNIKWIEDPTNKNNDFTRNFWRNQCLPLIETYYLNYKKTLTTFMKKQKELYELSYDIALTDGLKEVINLKSIDISELNNIRLKNLITYTYNSFGKSMEDRFYDQQVAHYKKNNHIELELNLKDKEPLLLIISNGHFQVSKNPHLKLKP